MTAKKHTPLKILLIIQIVLTVLFFLYLSIHMKVWDGYQLAVEETSFIYEISKILSGIVFIPAILTLLGFLPTMIAVIVSLILFFKNRSDKGLLIYPLLSFVTEFLLVFSSMSVLGSRILLSAITYSEMRFGASGPKASPRHVQLVDKFCPCLDAILSWDRAAVDGTTDIKVALRQAGTPIGQNDTAIAGPEAGKLGKLTSPTL